MAPAPVTPTIESESEQIASNDLATPDRGLEVHRGTKRTRLNQDTESRMSTPQQELLTPRALTPDLLTHPESRIEYFDDSNHPEYEWIRLPKQRGYNLYRVNHDAGSAAFEMWMPLTAVDHEGRRVTMWAKMDSGSDPNLIELSTLERLLGANCKQRLRAMTQSERDQYNLISGAQFIAKHSVDLDFEAGFARKRFERVNFIVVEQSARLADHDGVPNVLLGSPFLQDHSMLHKGLEYCHAAASDQDVIAPKAEEEVGGRGGPLPIVRVPASGTKIKRPAQQG
ncbi:hypothetical protein Tdes44962_MAKER03845 [Teratosphaeria destructans]|uniref:Uncharacterized protein n=1 Tax=Teratosphaeria destructans TaxID=418781 RepID=A0A9W7W0L4_9PEZI|nr:hypothetical protein Tdes44962_MAKER03845 [Teratosphaeria destructans]